MGLRKTPAALFAIGAAAALAITGCSSSSSTASGSQSSGSSTGSSSAPAQLTVWRMGADVPAQDTWLNGVVSQFHQQFPQYKNTTVKTVWVAWGNRTTDWNTALTSGQNGPDITELGNTDTPTEATLGGLSDISSYVNAWSGKSSLVQGMLANDTQNGTVYAVPWFGGVRGVWYRTDQFQKAGISSPPATWADFVTDAQKLMKTFPGTYGFDAITHDTNAFASFIWGAGGQIATQSNGQWTADLTSPADEAAIKFYVSLYTKYHLSPSKYIGQTELGNVGATAGGANADFALGKLDMYIDGPWATGNMPSNPVDKANWASFPIPSENGPTPAPVFAGGSDLAVFKTSKNPQAAWDLISVMDNVQNSTSFATQQEFFFPPYTTAASTSYPASNQLMTGFAKAAVNSQISPLNAKNWATADNGQYYIIPNMLKALMNGADFQSTVAKANTQLQNVLNNGTP
ncbi:MAG TPA: extracellular solute-binding protein [Streptosporangiaceae bacterium]|nr:extracellular solute-binding protein [Streptosporangiaceae bacterium]